jgi:hypothetical protein
MPRKTHGLSRTKLYRVWIDLNRRCNVASCPDFYHYGGRGIRVCKEWEDSFESFHAWAASNGYSHNLSIDRIDNNGNYDPSNCRWATPLEQNRNRRTNQLITFRGETKTITEFAIHHGLKPRTLFERIKSNWDVELALTKAPRNWGR